jgi:putative membrane protein
MMGAISALLLAGSAIAQPMSPMSPSDYLTAAGQSDQFEIQEGHLAQSQGGSKAVRDFGRRMVKDHTTSTRMLMNAAKRSGLPPPPPPPLRPDQQQMMSQLQAASGPAFDQLYVQQQLGAHQEALQLHQSYAQSGSDPQLKQAAGQIVPVVQQHLSMLQHMSGQ